MRSKVSVDGQRSFTETARRDQIIGAAIDVLADVGYAAASLAAIAGRLGVSKGILSYHFAGKSDVLSEVVASVLADAERAMTPQLQAATSYADALDRYLSSNLAFIATHRRPVLALTEILTNDRQIAEEYSRAQTQAVDALAGLLQGGVDQGEFGPVPVRSTAVAIRAAVDAVTGLMRADPEADIEAFGADLRTLFGRAVRRTDGPA